MSKFLHIGKRLREERERMGFNQADFAEIGGATRKTQYNYEAGERVPDGGYLAAIAIAGADVLYILTDIRTTLMQTAESLNPREAALLDNYRHVEDETDKKLIERTAFLAAKADSNEATEKKVVNGH